MNCAVACGVLGDADTALEHVRAADEVAKSRGTADDPQRLLAMLNVLVNVPNSEMTKTTVARVTDAIASLKDESRRAALLAEFDSIKAKLPNDESQ